MEIVFASNNEYKAREIEQLLGNKIKLLSLNDLNFREDIPEDEPDLEGNALFKARYIFNMIRKPVFADDTGLEVEALNGLPGVKSARFAGEARDMEANIDKLLDLLKEKGNRNARFRTVIAFITDGGEYIFEGIAEGTIVQERHGKEGFGYDPVFMPEGHKVTFAQMPLSEKNKISHRAKAFLKLKEFLSQKHFPDNKEAF